MKKLILVSCLLMLLTACAAPLGTITVHTVDEQNKLKSPLVESNQLINNKHTVYKTESNSATSGDDVFSIFLTDAYLRYLKDFGGINEVLIVVEFTEAVTGTSQDTITKILGPYNNIADATRAPLLNKVLYGPKKMESDLLTMNIKVYEYDLEENENNAAMLEFIAGAASTLALADPVTAGEIKVAKEIAQTLIRTNENDLVVNMDLDFVAGNKKYKTYSSSKVLPLKDSEIVVVKQEACRIGTCYDYFSGADDNRNGAGLVTDAILAIPTFFVKATTDVPDGAALKKFDSTKVNVGDGGLMIGSETFIDKTWLRFSIVKGGDPSMWNIRKALYPTEEEINHLLRNPNSWTVENMKAFTGRLEKLQKELEYANADLQLNSSTSLNGIHFIETNKASNTLCLNHSNAVKIASGQSQLLMNSLKTAAPKALSSAKNSTCFLLQADPANAATMFTGDEGHFQVNYTLGDTLISTFFPVKVVDKLTGSVTGNCKNNLVNERYTVDIPLDSVPPQQIKDVKLNGTAISFSKENSGLEFETSVLNPSPTLIDVFNGIASATTTGCTTPPT